MQIFGIILAIWALLLCSIPAIHGAASLIGRLRRSRASRRAVVQLRRDIRAFEKAGQR
ncbi:hypothetical protein [Winogradskya humida]|uniref:Uncharacterized protein n=1 Tax=Winogradskya humida TaxID=113566 RepID=A0ABQ4A733_9ACTN|nr:hypothetical protein [Actinoplanes humidus]GIE26670.1 hypothetical protein Ahu01nite_097720 [Actinoplanes humidus]